ncbi:hypothetical protein JDV02_000984 [Purpureocillium takamizusanense]|uniref:Uncharacterized protein n=1 Tax=Purpureocillium takamizusanense TaxID=2060973 RepID=A0A9Q8Q639_9HYPO|nr:uncharacterized protein JDV02_000984 [Purpureocillium takamizusanense]UNI14348.1 hypothetical protein JDV02_000984 [Purpureocillium takamizusanense]
MHQTPHVGGRNHGRGRARYVAVVAKRRTIQWSLWLAEDDGSLADVPLSPPLLLMFQASCRTLHRSQDAPSDGIHLVEPTDEMLAMTQYRDRGRNVVYGRVATGVQAPQGQSFQRKCRRRRRQSSAETRACLVSDLMRGAGGQDRRRV